MWDIASFANARVDVRADEIQKDEFVIVFQTRGDKEIACVSVAWQWISELSEADNWEL